MVYILYLKNMLSKKKKRVKQKKVISIDIPENLKSIGTLEGIIYRVPGHKPLMVHTFNTRPIIYKEAKSTLLLIHGGRFRFGKRGFIED